MLRSHLQTCPKATAIAGIREKRLEHNARKYKAINNENILR